MSTQSTTHINYLMIFILNIIIMIFLKLIYFHPFQRINDYYFGIKIIPLNFRNFYNFLKHHYFKFIRHLEIFNYIILKFFLFCLLYKGTIILNINL